MVTQMGGRDRESRGGHPGVGGGYVFTKDIFVLFVGVQGGRQMLSMSVDLLSLFSNQISTHEFDVHFNRLVSHVILG